MACHITPFKRNREERGNAITHPQSHPILEFRDGMGLWMDKAFPLVPLLL